MAHHISIRVDDKTKEKIARLREQGYNISELFRKMVREEEKNDDANSVHHYHSRVKAE